DVHAGLRQRRLELGVVGDVDLLRAELACLRCEAFHARSGDDARHVAAELRSLAENAERVLLQLVAVVFEEDERPGHQSAFRSTRNSTIFSAPEPSSSIFCVSPRGGGSPTP